MQKQVQEYYGSTLKGSQDLKTNACTIPLCMSPAHKKALQNIHPQVLDKFYGCGSPIPSSVQGLKVLDLGCGTGRDCYLCAQLVGQKGRVVGLDMTEAQLSVAKKYQQYHRQKFSYSAKNTQFLSGNIKDLKAAGLPADQFDLVISNCVINLCDDKKKVFEQIYQVLKKGGQFYFSDVYTDKEIPEDLQKDKVLWGQCLSGALSLQKFRRLMREAGFTDVRLVEKAIISIGNQQIAKRLQGYQFYSCTFRAFKLDSLVQQSLDLGQSCSFVGEAQTFLFDQFFVFGKGMDVRIDSNTALMLQQTRLNKLFCVSDPQKSRGPFKFVARDITLVKKGCC